MERRAGKARRGDRRRRRPTSTTSASPAQSAFYEQVFAHISDLLAAATSDVLDQRPRHRSLDQDGGDRQRELHLGDQRGRGGRRQPGRRPRLVRAPRGPAAAPPAPPPSAAPAVRPPRRTRAPASRLTARARATRSTDVACSCIIRRSAGRGFAAAMASRATGGGELLPWSCVRELPPEALSACDDVSLGFDGALTAKYGGSEACSGPRAHLVGQDGPHGAADAAARCRLTQFVDILDGAWVADLLGRRHGRRREAPRLLQDDVRPRERGRLRRDAPAAVRDAEGLGCEHLPHNLSSCVDGHIAACTPRSPATAPRPDAPASETLGRGARGDATTDRSQDVDLRARRSQRRHHLHR